MIVKHPAADARPEPSARLQIGVMVLLGLAAGSAYLTRHCIAVANTTIQCELELSEEQMGWVLAAFSAGYFFFQIPGGWLGNRIGTRAAFPLISSLWSVFTVWSSYATSLLMLGASRIAFGAGQAGLVPISATVIRDWFHENRRGVCSAVIGASMSVGGVIAMGLTGLLMESFDWRVVFRMYSLVGIAWAIGFYLFFRTKPEEHPWVIRETVNDDSPTEEVEDTERDESPVTSSDETPRSSTAELIRRIATNRTIWGINVQSFFRAAGYGLLVTWFPAFLEYRFGLKTGEAATMAMFPLAAVILGTILGGVMVDAVLSRTGSKWLSRVGMASAALGSCALLTLVSTRSESAIGFVILMSAGSLFSGFANPPAWAATMDVSGRHTAVVVGAMNMAGTMGGFSMPVVLGYMIGDIKKTGGDWNNVIYFVAAIYLAAALSWLLVDPNDTTDEPADVQQTSE